MSADDDEDDDGDDAGRKVASAVDAPDRSDINTPSRLSASFFN